jgi:hypothetical protein
VFAMPKKTEVTVKTPTQKKVYFLEFGRRGGYHTKPQRIMNKTDAAKLAASLVMVLGQDTGVYSANWRNWYLPKNSPKQNWINPEYFVSLFSVVADKQTEEQQTEEHY